MTRRIKPFAGQTALVAIALKEFFHVCRDRRILVLIVFLTTDLYDSPRTCFRGGFAERCSRDFAGQGSQQGQRKHRRDAYDTLDSATFVPQQGIAVSQFEYGCNSRV